MTAEIYLLILVMIVAFLYASVGHGGASGYLALMVLFGMNPAIMKSSALLLNLFVSAIAFIHYYRQRHFKLKLLLPFIILSIPCSFIGARIQPDVHVYKLVLAACLLLTTLRLAGIFGNPLPSQIQPVKFFPALILGSIIGFISGMIGIGGGILLSPLLLLLSWADIKQTAAVSAAFIFLNSLSGITGAASTNFTYSPSIFAWTLAAVLGGTAGAYYGSKRFNHVVLRYVLSSVLPFACTKLVIS